VVGSLFDYKSHLIARADVGIISTLLLIFAYATSRAYLFSFHRLGKHLPGRQGKH
jgi:hypothetical protein